MLAPQDTRSVAELVAGAFGQLSDLMRSEIQLARAEMTQKVAGAGIGIGLIGGGAIVTIAALVLVLSALAALLVDLGVAEPLADLLAGLVGLALSGLLAWLGINRIRGASLTPDRTINQLQRDVASAKEHV